MPKLFSLLPKSFAALFALMALCALAPVAQAQTSLFADPKAHAEGDIVTIVLAERTAASRESGWKNSSDSKLGASAAVAGGEMAGSFGADARFENDAAARNQSVQSDLLHGTISAQVVSVDAAGNLAIKGQRRLNVNGETHLMTVTGIVRPYDIQYDNTILSHQIASADIVYERESGGFHLSRPGTFAKIGAAAALLAALVLAGM